VVRGILACVGYWLTKFFQEIVMAAIFDAHSFMSRLAGGLFLGLFCLTAPAQTSWSSNPQADNSAQAVKARYEADKKLCADEASPEARLQCRRDAQAIHDKAVANIKPGVYQTKPAPCTDCGHVTAVNVGEKAGDSNNAVGLIAGGLAGAVMGRQVGGGFGKDLATIAGVAGGAYAGKKIQESMGASKVWTVSVKYTAGHTANFEFTQDPGMTVGDAVKNSGNTVVRN
jgi:uncharacterized protein YcfJ